MKRPENTSRTSSLDGPAETYVRLILAIGEHDPDYVDAYFGPPEWRDASKKEYRSLGVLKLDAQGLLDNLGRRHPGSTDDIEALRYRYLLGQTRAALARIGMLQGNNVSFDEEALALYDARPPSNSDNTFLGILNRLDTLLPGTGPIPVRYEQYRKAFIIPVPQLDNVFQTAISECRSRTELHIKLPENERFRLEYVTNKPWSGYNWYKGDSFSLIQINTDLPITIDRAVDLAAHEGYPGHHVYNSSLEQHLVKKRGWVEFTVYALFSPQSLIAEGTANFGIEVAFPGKERIEFEESVLFPLAGMDGAGAERYYSIHKLTTNLNYAHNEAARGYLNGSLNRSQAEEYLVTFALLSQERASQRVRFIDTYRSYVINYNLGQDLVRQAIESRGGTPDNPAKRWEEFKRLIASPRLPSGL